MYYFQISPFSSLSFRIAATIISLTCIFYTLLMHRKSNARSRLFLVLLFIVFIDSIIGLLEHVAVGIPNAYSLSFLLVYILEFTYYLTHFALPYIFFLYVVNVCFLNYRYSRKIFSILSVPFIFMELMLFSNPVTHLVFKLNNFTVVRGIGIYIAYAISAVYLLFGIFILTKYWTVINQMKRMAMFYFISLSIVGIFIQMIFPEIKCELLCEAIGLMGLMIMIEKGDDKLDTTTIAYNRVALINDLNSFIDMHIPLKILCVRIDNSESYRRITGFDNFNLILEEIVVFLINIYEDCNVYKLGDANFFILCPRASDEDISVFAESIAERFEQGFISAGGTTTVATNILCANVPEQFNSPEDIMLLADVPLDLNISHSKNILKNEDIDFLIRNIGIEKAISSGINSGSFHVQYQPVYGKKCGCIKAMQALLRLNDSNLGDINYNEFMPIAERIGLSDTLEEKMIESIFRFVGTEISNENINIDFVLIHLMSVRVIHKRLVETIMGLKYKYNVDPSIIIFDIDDSILNFGNEHLTYVLNELYDAGFGLYLGNYDISNLGQNEEVLNKFMGVVLTAWKFLGNEYISQGHILLRTRTDMLDRLGKEVIITGVDDAECYHGIVDSCALYMSGKYLAPSLSKEEIIKKFKEHDRVQGLDI